MPTTKSTVKPMRDTRENNADSYNKQQTNYYTDPRTRVLQHELVFINGLPSNLSDRNLLNSSLYFGRYGNVCKVITNPATPSKKDTLYQIYATFSNELEASLAIVALDGFCFDERPLKVSYGTTKYCSHFLKGRECLNEDCFYLHQFNKSREVMVNNANLTAFKEQNSRAIDLVLDHIEDVIKKILKSKNQNVEEGFPSLTEMVEYLIDGDYLDGKYYDTLFSEIQKEQAAKKQQIQKPKQKPSSHETRVQESVEENASTHEPTLTKSNSFSTMATPSKQENLEPQEENIKEGAFSTIENKTSEQAENKIQESEYCKVSSSRQTKSQNKESSCQNLTLRLDSIETLGQNIEKRIIKNVLNKRIRSKLDFAQTNHRCEQIVKEAKKIQSIVQKVLIVPQ